MALTGVAFTDNLPAGLVVATPNGLGGTCTGTVTATAGSGSISLTGGTVAAASSCTVIANVTGAAVGTYNNTSGAVTSTNGGTGNTASATLQIAVADLTITKTHTGTFHRGQTGAQYFRERPRADHSNVDLATDHRAGEPVEPHGARMGELL